MKKNVLAFDFGASSGRAIVGEYDEGQLKMTEIHRFANGPIEEAGTLYWDIDYLFEQIIVAIKKAVKVYDIDSLGIDTWGVDFGLLNDQGELLDKPVHYRDRRTKGMIEKVGQIIPLQELYERTGNQVMEINTLFQLFSIKEKNPEQLKKAATLLMMPDLLNYLLTGVKRAERSIASTSQIMNPVTKNGMNRC